MQNLRLICRANQTFRLTRDLSAYLADFDLPNCVIRLQMRQGPFLAVEKEWVTGGGGAVYSAGSVVFSAPVKDVLNFKGTYYGDIRIEAASGDPRVIAQCTFVWEQGHTRTTADASEADVTVLVDTVEVAGGADLFPMPLWADASQSSFTAPGVFTDTQANLNVRSLINQASPATWFHDIHPAGHYQTEAITGAIDVPAGATVHECSAVAGYVRSKKNVAYGSDAALYGQAVADADNASIIGGNFENWVNSGYTTGIVSQGGVFRTRLYSPGVNAVGLSIAINGSVAPASGAAISVLSQDPAVTKWPAAFVSGAGAAALGLSLQQVAAGVSQNSQSISLTGADAGGVARSASIYADLNGGLVLDPNTAVVILGGLGVASGVVASSTPFTFSQTWNDGGGGAGVFSTFEIRNTNTSSNTAASDLFAVYGGAAGTTQFFKIAGTGNASFLGTLSVGAYIITPQVIGGSAAGSSLTLLPSSVAGTGDIVIGTNLTDYWHFLGAGGHFRPTPNGTLDIGDATHAIRDIYVGRNLIVGAVSSPGGVLHAVSPSTTSNTQFTFDGAASTAGINLRLIGNGATTPNKTIRVINGAFQIINNAYTASILSLTDAGALTIASTGSLTIGSNQVIGPRNTGWAAMTGTADKGTAYDTASMTLSQLAERVKALQDAFTTHGAIGA